MEGGSGGELEPGLAYGRGFPEREIDDGGNLQEKMELHCKWSEKIRGPRNGQRSDTIETRERNTYTRGRVVGHGICLTASSDPHCSRTFQGV